MDKVDYLVILNDGETWSSLEGCLIVGIAEGNALAEVALDEEDLGALLRVADIVEPVRPPAAVSGRRL